MPSKGPKQQKAIPDISDTKIPATPTVDAPPYWSHNWTRNFQRIKEYAMVIREMCTISAEDYDKVHQKKTHNMQSIASRDIIANYVCNLSLLPEWIDNGIIHLNMSEGVPESCILKSYDMKLHQSTWMTHILTERIENSSMFTKCESLISEIEEKLSVFDKESEIEYSSYSDYSDSSYDSEEDELDEEEEDKKNASVSQASFDDSRPHRRRRQ